MRLLKVVVVLLACVAGTGCVTSSITSHETWVTDEVLGAWYVRTGIGTDNNSEARVFYCSGGGKCRQATTEKPLSKARITKCPDGSGERAWVVGAPKGEDEAMFLCVASGGASCVRQVEQ